MGGLLTQPVTKKKFDQGEGLGLRYSICSMQGYRPQMEDAHDVKIGLQYGLSDWSYFAVFDGHAGKSTAAYAAYNLLEYILRGYSKFNLCLDTDHLTEPLHLVDPPRAGSSTELQQESTDQPDPQNIRDESSQIHSKKTSSDDRSTGNEISNFSKCLSKETPKSTGGQQELFDTQEKADVETKPGLLSFPVWEQLHIVRKAIKKGFLKLDHSLSVSATQDVSGCTAICAFISPTHLFIANCGDSRAVLFDGFKAKFSTEDHKPFKPEERHRIVRAGGVATQRINGTLAVSRALGDFEFKKNSLKGPCDQLVSPEPEVTVLERHPYDEFLILACDGIWDVINNDELCLFIHHQLYIEPNLDNICSLVLDVCLRKGSKDNMSIILIVFESAPKFDKLQLATDKRHDQMLLAYADMVQERELELDIANFPNFFLLLKNEMEQDPEFLNILPPGAGIEAKYELFENRWYANHGK